MLDKPHVKPLLNAFHVLITSYLLYHYLRVGKRDIQTPGINFNERLKTDVWCTGNKHTTRFCRFENLCYRPQTEEWVFLRDENSTIVGIPKDRFDPALAELSSVVDHNLQYFQYVEMPSKTLNEMDLRISFVKEKVLLFNRFHPENIMHALHDDLLPLYVTRKQLGIPDLKILYMDKKPRQGQYTILYDHLLGDNQLHIRDFNQSGLYCFQEVRVGVNKATTWYQYGFRVPQGPLKKNHTHTASEIRKFRNYMLEKMNIVPNDTVTPSKRISVLLTRKHNRLITNQAYVALVITKANKKRCLVANQEKYSLQEIINYVHQSGLIVGMHGSLLSLAIFLPDYAGVLELFPYGINPHYYTPYKTLASLPGMKLTYKAWENKNEKKTTTHPNNPPELGGIAHLPFDVQERIKNSKQVGRHLCCSDPEWLYRAYQDTNVDLKIVGNVVNEIIEERNKVVKKAEELKDQNREINALINPGKVQHAICNATGEKTVEVRWAQPWNLDYLNNTNVEYEIWVQRKKQEEVKAYILKATKYEFELEPKEEYLLWIRCLRDKIQGPFTEAISCKT